MLDFLLQGVRARVSWIGLLYSVSVSCSLFLGCGSVDQSASLKAISFKELAAVRNGLTDRCRGLGNRGQ